MKKIVLLIGILLLILACGKKENSGNGQNNGSKELNI